MDDLRLEFTANRLKRTFYGFCWILFWLYLLSEMIATDFFSCDPAVIGNTKPRYCTGLSRMETNTYIGFFCATILVFMAILGQFRDLPRLLIEPAGVTIFHAFATRRIAWSEIAAIERMGPNPMQLLGIETYMLILKNGKRHFVPTGLKAKTQDVVGALSRGWNSARPPEASPAERP
ncbi:hypothetical protein ACFSM5_12185 [Lacibacterium aquatile]|uniref:PH domain-containing protein n=1 Tax=Lacibacterium aquatile TaxID=1168082 RepID=A0ABW5DT91_9PROT